MTLTVARPQALAYRVAAQSLLRDVADPVDLDVLSLGVQDSSVGSARLALAARLERADIDFFADPAFTLLWSVRGAPHVHRTADLRGLAGELWPVSEADATARLKAERKPLKAAGIDALTAFSAAAAALRDAVPATTSKGDASRAVTDLLPDAYAYACRSCQATHIYGGLFQSVGLFAGVHLVSGASPTTLAPLAEQPPLPPAAAGPGRLLRGYLRLYGPATLAEAAGYLATSQKAIRSAWPADLVEMRLDGRRVEMPPEQVDALEAAQVNSDVVRLLPPLDPYLQARDRDLLVPDANRQKALWRILGNPGAVLAGAEVAGVWRARMAGRARLDVTVQLFDDLPASGRRKVAEEAARVAAVRGASDLRVRYEDSYAPAAP